MRQHKTLEQINQQHANDVSAHNARLDRAQRYRATRQHFPRRKAHEVLTGIRENATWTKRYPPTGNPYNPMFVPEGNPGIPEDCDHYRWIENVHDAGLRVCGFADEINRHIQHQGWYYEPGEFANPDEVYRGIVCQLPARNGFPQYVYGYADPFHNSAALLNFHIIEGAYGGTEAADAGELCAAASNADTMAQMFAEREKDYQAKEYARQDAEEKRAEAKALRDDLCGHIRTERQKIADLLKEADDLLDNPWQLFS